MPDSAKPQASDNLSHEMQLGAVGEALTLTNTCLIILIGYLIYHLFGPRFRKSKDKEEDEFKLPEPLPKHDMTLDELHKYDGTSDNKRICIAILGRVYDVTKSFHFYGPGRPYGTLAGRDATRALAKFDVMAVKLEWDDVSDLTSSEMSSVEEWKEQFDERYDYIGRLVRSVEEIIDTPDISTTETKTTDGEGDTTEKENDDDDDDDDDEVQVLSRGDKDKAASNDSSDEVEIIDG